MQFTITNNCEYPICVFSSREKYSSRQLENMIKPKEVLKKVIYDHYWHNHLTDDWVLQVQKIVPSMTYYGYSDSTDSIEVYNINRVPEYIYAFFVQIIDKKVTLLYHLIPAKKFFNEYNDMAIYQYKLRIRDGDHEAISVGDPNTGALIVDYFSIGREIDNQVLEWMPSMEQSSSHTWLIPLLGLIFILCAIFAIVIVFMITLRQPNSVTKFISNRVENIEAPKEPEYLS